MNRVGGFSAEDNGAAPGTDWLSAGAGLRFELANGVALLTDYEGAFFRSSVAQHFASVKLSFEWGSFLPKSKSKGSSDCAKAVAYAAYDGGE
ncbi:MAG: hypothetical protein L3J39_10520 [Verrucomicrobiales bacterium]|nr:hypothetical protein [Verrucomicrobiales bacterium]